MLGRPPGVPTRKWEGGERGLWVSLGERWFAGRRFAALYAVEYGIFSHCRQDIALTHTCHVIRYRYITDLMTACRGKRGTDAGGGRSGLGHI